MVEEFRFLFYTMLHPYNGFDAVKYERKGSVKTAVLVALLFFLQNVISAAGSGFLFTYGDPDKISVPNIFIISIGALVFWIVSNWAVDSLMDAEGKVREIIIVTTYALMPYIIFSLANTIIGNFATNELRPFMNMLSIVGMAWSVFILFVGMYQIHQLTFGGTVGILLLTVFGMAVMIFILVLLYSLYQQVYIFLYTLFSEIMFRM
ncbi:MAG TPA: YIP1 family protein [Candidatus Atribacteria bacterium]|nr:YIP1 family protein [Candidatus Atribacteria bacterium]